MGVCLWREAGFAAIFEGLERGRERGLNAIFEVSRFGFLTRCDSLGRRRRNRWSIWQFLTFRRSQCGGVWIGGDEMEGACRVVWGESSARAAEHGLHA